IAQQMHRQIVVRQLLQIKCNPHAIRGGTTKVAVQLHCYVSSLRAFERQRYRHRTTHRARRQIMRTLNSPTPSTPPFIRSPFTTAATPSGVPVKIRSPGCSSNSVDRYAIVSATDQINCDTSERCFSAPFTDSQIAPLPGWPTFDTGWIGPSGAE